MHPLHAGVRIVAMTLNMAPDIEPKLRQLDRLLQQSCWLWRPQPFKQRMPEWCARLPQLCRALLDISDQQLKALSGDSRALRAMLQPHIPELAQLALLTQLPECKRVALEGLGPHFHSGIPGRKWQQLKHFSQALGPVERPLLEWCGGKGHLGRLLGAQWQQPVLTVEHDNQLCEAGERFAERSGVRQRFLPVDALSSQAGLEVVGRHAVALHACGELHRKLLRDAVQAGSQAFDIVPCCYYLGAGESYTPFSEGLALQLTRDDLRLAVTETVTAAGREVAKRDQEMAWKLGYDELRRGECAVADYLPIKPIKKGWLNLSFEGFCHELAKREGRILSQSIDWQHYEEAGWLRQREVMRLSLVRAAFRRGLEMWLVLDMANYIGQSGYDVCLGTFCSRELTPRNILISARKNIAT